MTSSQILDYYKTQSSMRDIYFRCAKYVSQVEDMKSEKSRHAISHLFSFNASHRGCIAAILENFTSLETHHSWPPGLYYLFPIGYKFEKISLPADLPEELELKLATMGF